MESIVIKVYNTNNELLKQLYVVKYTPVSLKGLFSSFVDDFVKQQEEWDDYNDYSYQFKYNGRKFNENIIFHPIGETDGTCDNMNSPYEFVFEYVITNPSQKVATPYQREMPFIDPPQSGSIGFECSTADAIISYRFSDNDFYTDYVPNTWVQYSGDSEYVEYYAYKEGMRNSELVHEMLIVITPVITHEDNVVTITCATNGAQILYRVPGGTQWIEYTGPISDSNYGYKAMAVKKDINGVRIMADSDWAEE